MRFAAPFFLLGTLLALAVGALLIGGALLLVRARRRFGDDARVTALVSGRTGPRRALKAVLLVLALALAFLAAAQPQYGRGTRRIPATNLDVAIVLDFSKSMYARDVKPSRIERAKGEVATLVRELPGARFGAVAFAGEAMRFPLTSDGGAIAQFFRQLEPNDMPVGGTAIARALGAAQEVLRSDPLAKKHQQVVLLITDGEDLEGDPVSVAAALAADHVPVHVVQIGGRTPEPIPDVDETGEMVGYRRDESGQPLMTSLSAEGEATLTRIAEAGGGSVVRGSTGGTGIVEITRRLRRLMTEELSEKVETVYADVFHLPLGLALLLLLVETVVRESARPRPRRPVAPPQPRRARARARAPRRGGGAGRGGGARGGGPPPPARPPGDGGRRSTPRSSATARRGTPTTSPRRPPTAPGPLAAWPSPCSPRASRRRRSPRSTLTPPPRPMATRPRPRGSGCCSGRPGSAGCPSPRPRARSATPSARRARSRPCSPA